MRKKKIALLFWFIVLAGAIAVGMIYIKQSSRYWYKNVEISEYGFKISYPNSYVDIPKETENIEEIANNITSIIVKENVNTPGVSVDLVEEILHAKSDITNLTIYVEAIKKEKTKKTIEDICKDYLVMFKVFNEYEEVLYEKHEEVTIDGVPAGRTEVFVRGKTDGVYPGMISYLIPLEDREITIVFMGTQELFDYFGKEIKKIVASVELEERLPESENVENISGE